MNEIKYLDPTRTQELITETKTRLATKQDIIQVENLPAASEEVVGKVYQYIGANTQSYASGYFYKCVSDGAASPTYSWVRIDVQPGGGSASIVKGYRKSSNGKFYEEDTYTTLIQGNDNTIYIDIPTKYQYEYDSSAKVFNELGEKMPDVATEYDVGIVKPDNLTIFVNENGTIRTRVWAGTQAEYDEQKYRIPNDTTIIIGDSIVTPEGDTYVNGVKIVPWALGSDEDIVAMVQGHYDGKIDLYDYWNVGDTRKIHIKSKQSGMMIIKSWDIDATLINKGYGNNNVAFAVSLGIVGHGYIVSSMKEDNLNSWGELAIKDWFLDSLYSCIPETIRPIFKKFDYICATRYDSDTTTTYNDYFTFFAEKEICGTRVYSNEAEANALQQIPWFEDKIHRVLFDDSSIPTLSVIPEPSEECANVTYKYIGETKEEYDTMFYNGHFYECYLNYADEYQWFEISYGRYWTRSLGADINSSGKVFSVVSAYYRTEDRPDRTSSGAYINTYYVPFGCI